MPQCCVAKKAFKIIMLLQNKCIWFSVWRVCYRLYCLRCVYTKCEATRSNLNLTLSTTCERFQPVANFVSGCLTLLTQNCWWVVAYFEQGCRNPGGSEGYIPPNNLTVSPPIVWVWSTSASPPIIWLWCASERRCSLEVGEKQCSIFGEDLFFGLHLICSPEQNRGRGSSPLCWK